MGVTLYSLVYGNVPFFGETVPLLYEKIKHESVVFSQTVTISNHLKNCLLNMLQKDPNKRITIPQLKVLIYESKTLFINIYIVIFSRKIVGLHLKENFHCLLKKKIVVWFK